MNVLRQEVWLADESPCLPQKSVAVTIRSFLWMPTCGSVYAGLDASHKGICSSSLVTSISVSAHLTSAGREKAFFPLLKATNLGPSTWQCQSFSYLDIASRCPSFQVIWDLDPASPRSLQTVCSSLFCLPGYRTVCSAHLLPAALFLVAWCFNQSPLPTCKTETLWNAGAVGPFPATSHHLWKFSTLLSSTGSFPYLNLHIFDSLTVCGTGSTSSAAVLDVFIERSLFYFFLFSNIQETTTSLLGYGYFSHFITY